MPSTLPVLGSMATIAPDSASWISRSSSAYWARISALAFCQDERCICVSWASRMVPMVLTSASVMAFSRSTSMVITTELPSVGAT